MSAEAVGYKLLDEPSPSRISHLAVQPLWPLLAVMFGGAWLSWPWFVVNAFAFGSPTRRREALWAVGGFLGTALLLFGLTVLRGNGTIDDVALRYFFVLVLVWKLTVSYWLYILQARTFGLYRHFGGVVRTGLAVVIVGAVLRRPVLDAVPSFFAMVLS